MSKTLCLVAVLVLAMIINVSAGTVTITEYNDGVCGAVAQSASGPSDQCVNSQKAVCNGTNIAVYTYGDTACQTQKSVSNYPNGQCVPISATNSLKFTCTSSAWTYAPSMLIIAMVSVLTFFGVKRF